MKIGYRIARWLSQGYRNCYDELEAIRFRSIDIEERMNRALEGIDLPALDHRLTEMDLNVNTAMVDMNDILSRLDKIESRVLFLELEGDGVVVDSVARRVAVIQDRLDQLWARVYRYQPKRKTHSFTPKEDTDNVPSNEEGMPEGGC